MSTCSNGLNLPSGLWSCDLVAAVGREAWGALEGPSNSCQVRSCESHPLCPFHPKTHHVPRASTEQAGTVSASSVLHRSPGPLVHPATHSVSCPDPHHLVSWLLSFALAPGCNLPPLRINGCSIMNPQRGHRFLLLVSSSG